MVSFLLCLSPLTAVMLGWLFLDQNLSPGQLLGMTLIIGGIWFGQRSQKNGTIKIRSVRR